MQTIDILDSHIRARPRTRQGRADHHARAGPLRHDHARRDARDGLCPGGVTASRLHDSGVVAESGPPAHVFENPQHPRRPQPALPLGRRIHRRGRAGPVRTHPGDAACITPRAGLLSDRQTVNGHNPTNHPLMQTVDHPHRGSTAAAGRWRLLLGTGPHSIKVTWSSPSSGLSRSVVTGSRCPEVARESAPCWHFCCWEKAARFPPSG